MRLVPRRGGEGEGTEFIVFSDDWGEHPSSSQHLFRRIAKSHRVTWVNTVGMRNPTLSAVDLRKGIRKIAKMTLAARSNDRQGALDTPVIVYRPVMLPFSRYRPVRTFNAWSVARCLRELLNENSLHPPTVVTTVPNVGDYCDALGASRLIYYCVDDFTQWPGFEASLIREMESRLIARADVLIGASDELSTRFRAFGKPTFTLTHGVDLDVFGRLAAVEHPALARIPHPRAGFFGLIDARMDHELVAVLARSMPDFSFVFAGPIGAAGVPIVTENNVHYIGSVPYGELPALIVGFDVLMLPYRTGDLGETLSPLKLKEYLATGKAVVSSPIAEARKWAAFVTLAANAEEWQEGLRSAGDIEASSRKSDIAEALTVESWESKACQFLEICGCASDVACGAS